MLAFFNFVPSFVWFALPLSLLKPHEHSPLARIDANKNQFPAFGTLGSISEARLLIRQWSSSELLLLGRDSDYDDVKKNRQPTQGLGGKNKETILHFDGPIFSLSVALFFSFFFFFVLFSSCFLSLLHQTFQDMHRQFSRPSGPL